MWFVLLAIALLVVVVGGLYFRRRTLRSLEIFGVSRRGRRVVGWVIPWLLYGYPIMVFSVVGVNLAIGSDAFTTPPTGVFEWLFIYPFFISILVVLQAVPYLLLFDLASLIARRRVAIARLQRYRAIACLGITAVFLVYTPARIIIERGALDVNHYEVGPGAEHAERFRIAFVADLQQDHITDEARATRVASLVNREKPDIVLGGGDWINTGPDHIEAAARSAGKLRSRLGTTSVRGDHEHFAYRDPERSVAEVTAAMKRHGVDILHNEVRTFAHAGKQIAVIYLSHNYKFRAQEHTITELLGRASSADYKILITHQFDKNIARQVKDRVDLALIAHTHGGQVNPVVGFFHANLARVETPYVAGRYQLGKTTLIVTSGIGYSIAPFRYASVASVEIIDLRL